MKNRQKMYQTTSLILIIDQLVKIIINHTMEIHQEIKVIPNLFSLYYVKNTGAAFSILENNTTLLIIITVIFIIILNRLIIKEKNLTKLTSLSLGLVMGGMFGNLIDRIIYHGVIDYFSIMFFKYRFPIFNIADIGITMGVILLCIDTYLQEKKQKLS